MKHTRRICAAVLVLGLTAALCACGSTGTVGSTASAALETSAAATAATTPAQESAAPADTAQATPATGASAGAVIEPEQVLSRVEAEKLVGNALKDGEKKDEDAVGLKLRVYDATAEGGRFLQVLITQQSFAKGTTQTPKDIYLGIKSAFPDAVKVDGVGDEAFITVPGIYILSGDYYLQVAVGSVKDAKNIEILKEAGKQAVENLKKLVG